MKRRAAFRAMLVVAVADVARRRDTIAAALTGGIDAVQLRDRDADGRALLEAAAMLRELTRPHRAVLVVNDRADVALAARADGLHLPAAGFSVAQARQMLGDDLLIGRSTHASDEARAAALAGADYVILGPIFATPSKRAYGPPLGVAAVASARTTAPLIAIGGIAVAEAAAVRRAGATGIAVVRAVLDADDPEAAARALIRAVDAAS